MGLLEKVEKKNAVAASSPAPLKKKQQKKQAIKHAVKKKASPAHVAEPAIEKPSPAPQQVVTMKDLKALIEQRLKTTPPEPTNYGTSPVSGKLASGKARADPWERLPSGIPGLDEIMEGGFRKNTVTLIVGGAGSGKSILSMQYLVHGIEKHKETGVYISFEESKEKILSEFKRFGWDLEKKVKDKKLIILQYTPEQVGDVLKAGGGIIRDTIESIHAKRLVIDSLTAFSLLYKDELSRRKACLQLFESLARWDMTTLMTEEKDVDPDKQISSETEFSVDGVILLYHIRKGDIRERAIEVIKLRGTNHATKLFPVRIDNHGLIVYPEGTVF
ncbi:AAA family ATPase [Candidatus Woesearchaeota archaeon]|nr:MAG: hypothetical protein QS99_C0017G0001 [archaeon GW2011_AR4]MBS3130318.1 AAA family ATPase [Candidatus Woesearchaeota archaeon]HIH38961.1 AAA family ATPase [Candidatus Woesearchaeota archaeon]HIJ03422.1 AAA family ATPase [Candidatus Woesearchaeota archaeon]